MRRRRRPDDPDPHLWALVAAIGIFCLAAILVIGWTEMQSQQHPTPAQDALDLLYRLRK